MSIRRKKKRHTRFNNTNNHLQFDAFDEFIFDDKKTTFVVIILNVKNIVYNKIFAIKKFAKTRFHINKTI